MDNVEKTPIGNHIASHFHNCHTHIIKFSIQAPFNDWTSDLPRTVYTYPNTYLSTIGGAWRTSDGNQKIQRLSCMLTMVPVLHRDVCADDFGFDVYQIFSQDSVFWYGPSFTKEIMSQHFVLCSILDEILGQEDRDTFETCTDAFVEKFLYKANLFVLFSFQIDPRREPIRSTAFLHYCWHCAKE